MTLFYFKATHYFKTKILILCCVVYSMHRNKIHDDNSTYCERGIHGPICRKDPPAFCIK